MAKRQAVEKDDKFGCEKYHLDKGVVEFNNGFFKLEAVEAAWSYTASSHNGKPIAVVKVQLKNGHELELGASASPGSSLGGGFSPTYSAASYKPNESNNKIFSGEFTVEEAKKLVKAILDDIKSDY